MANSVNEIIKTIMCFVNESNEINPILDNIDPQASIIKSGVLDSLKFLELLSFLEEKYSIEIDFEEEDPDIFTTFMGLSQIIYRLVNKC